VRTRKALIYGQSEKFKCKYLLHHHSKKQRGNRQSDVDCICAFCLTPFRVFTTTNIRVHLAGESQGDNRVAATSMSRCLQAILCCRTRTRSSKSQRKNSTVRWWELLGRTYGPCHRNVSTCYSSMGDVERCENLLFDIGSDTAKKDGLHR
jgi:hypothetical protein